MLYADVLQCHAMLCEGLLESVATAMQTHHNDPAIQAAAIATLATALAHGTYYCTLIKTHAQSMNDESYIQKYVYIHVQCTCTCNFQQNILCMYICTCIYMYVYTCTCIHACTCTFLPSVPEGRLPLLFEHGHVLDLVLQAMTLFSADSRIQHYSLSFLALLVSAGEGSPSPVYSSYNMYTCTDVCTCTCTCSIRVYNYIYMYSTVLTATEDVR